MVEARFDDLSAGPAGSFRFVGPLDVVTAHCPDQVEGALAAVEAASAAGHWAAGFLSYEAAPGLDPSLSVRRRSDTDPFRELPLVWFGIFQGWEDSTPAGTLPDGRSAGANGYAPPWRPSVDRATYEAAVERIREMIRAGETYQVNHTFRLDADIRTDAAEALYADLLQAQRAAHCAYLDTGRFRILSASPEMFVRVQGDTLTTRPMKGTAPRGRWPAEDQANAEALIGSAKERAENAMIVDLLRNDMGRVSVPGSVHVTRMFETERYETVWQLTSTIASTLEPGIGSTDLMRALFPSGSVTGAPKVRSMQIIAELEDSPRGVYTGAVGWLAPRGEHERMAFNVAIRTVELDSVTGAARFGVGSGITHDSIAAGEYEECLTKAKVLTERRPEFDLFESIRHDETGWLWLDEHLDRLAGSAAYFAFTYDQAAVRKALDAAAGGLGPEPMKVRLTLSRRGRVGVEVEPVPAPASGPASLAVELERRTDPSDVFLFHKTTLRDAYAAAAAAHPEADDVVFVNDRGEITETTVANILLRLGGRWVTPAQDCGLLAGTHRRKLLESGDVTEAHLTLDNLRSAEAIELVSSVRMRRPARLA